MLELIFLVWFGKKLSAMASEKGRSGWWAALGVAFWIGGEIMGFVVGALLGLDMGSYGVALLFAMVGAVVAYFVVNALPRQGMLAADY